jgi:hypothetical protein
MAIDRRLARGQLRILHRGVYAVGYGSLTWNGRWLAAVLAAGDGAVLSHRAAAAKHCVWNSERLEVTVRRSRRDLRGITVHQARLPEDEVVVEDGIPVTSISRTLFDLATVLQEHQLERAANEAEMLRLTDRLSLPVLLARYPRRRGRRAIAAILAKRRDGARRTKSELESGFLAFVDSIPLPRPETNVPITAGDRRFECDCVWRERLLVVELDGRGIHGTAMAFEDDRAKDRALNVAGWRTVRVTWNQLQHDRQALRADLITLLGAG